MKISLLLIGTIVAQDRTIAPQERLANIQTGLTDWCTMWLPDYKRKEKLNQKLSNLMGFMNDKFALDCAIQNLSDTEQDEMAEDYDAAMDGSVRMDGMDEALARMNKYVRVIRRVNRVYLAECKRPNKNKQLADKLGKKLEGAFNREHKIKPITTSSEAFTSTSEPITTPSDPITTPIWTTAPSEDY